MQGNWEAAIRKAVARKLRSSVEEGCEEAIRTFQGWVVNWTIQPDFEYSVYSHGDVNVTGTITVEDFEVEPGITRWETIDKGTRRPVSINQMAEGRPWPMRFPFTQPYPAKSIAADGSGGGEGRVGPAFATMKISNRSIEPRGWTKKIRERYPYIKIAMKRRFTDG